MLLVLKNRSSGGTRRRRERSQCVHGTSWIPVRPRKITDSEMGVQCVHGNITDYEKDVLQNIANSVKDVRPFVRRLSQIPKRTSVRPRKVSFNR